MHVQVDDARHDIHAFRVDLARAGLRTTRRVDGDVRNSDARNVDDAAALDDDVDRATGRSARPVDQRRAADDQPLEGAVALMAVRREFRVLALLVAQVARGPRIWSGGRSLLRVGVVDENRDENGSQEAHASHDDTPVE